MYFLHLLFHLYVEWVFPYRVKIVCINELSGVIEMFYNKEINVSPLFIYLYMQVFCI